MELRYEFWKKNINYSQEEMPVYSREKALAHTHTHTLSLSLHTHTHTHTRAVQFGRQVSLKIFSLL